MPMEWMLLPLKRYADFQGRSRRREYWLFTLALIVLATILALFAGVTSGGAGDGAGASIGLILLGILLLAVFIPSLAVQVRRFHDQNRSGWLVLLGLIPYIGGPIVLVFMCLPGTPGPNRFGEDPKGADLGEVFR
jgi:uncharacterized membrane protein YhaH (DUF805 family)